MQPVSQASEQGAGSRDSVNASLLTLASLFSALMLATVTYSLSFLLPLVACLCLRGAPALLRALVIAISLVGLYSALFHPDLLVGDVEVSSSTGLS